MHAPPIAQPEVAPRRPTLLPGVDLGAPTLTDFDMPTLGKFLAAGSRHHYDTGPAMRMVHGQIGHGGGGETHQDYHGYR